MQISGVAGLRVLVVEDEALIAMMVEDMLTEIGCVVAGSAPDATGALALVRSEMVDVVILDVHLADGECYRAADEMLKQGLKVVFSTGDNRSDIPPAYADLPCVIKPFTLSDLAGELNHALEHH